MTALLLFTALVSVVVIVACAAGYVVNNLLGAADPWLVEQKPRRKK